MADVSARVSREKLRGILRSLPGVLAGRAGTTRIAESVLAALGMEALSLIREAYVEKARGGTDAAGLSWSALSPRTIAYHRRHPALSRQRRQASSERRPTLSKAHDALWRRTFSQAKKAALRKGAGEDEASARAAAIAWKTVKAAGAQTVLERYGSVKVEIGRDTGRLLASLTPGRRGGDQVFDVSPGSVRVGTNVAYAQHFHKRRPLWVEPEDWPTVWTDRLRMTLAETLKRALPDLFRGAV